MAVVSIKELWSGRTGRDTYTRQRTYTRVFEVYTDDPADEATVAGGDLSLPRLGEQYPADADAVVVAVVPSQDDDEPLRWLVQIDYDTQPPLPEAVQPTDGAGGGGGTQPLGSVPDNPLSRPAIWRFSFQQTQEVLRKSYQHTNGVNDLPEEKTKPVKNSAQFPFDPPVMVEVSRPLVSVTKNLPTFSLPEFRELQDAVNSEPWHGIPALCAKCVGVEAQSGFENGVYFWSYTWTFALNFDTWILEVLDAGWIERLIERDEETGDYTTIGTRAFVDEAGNPRTEPTLLDRNGRELADGADEVYLKFSAYPQKDYNVLVPV